MSNFFDRNQPRTFFIVAIIVLAACGVLIALWAKKPIDWKLIEAASNTIVIAAGAISAGVVVGIQLLSHDYDWWGNAKESIAFIATGALLTIGGAVFELIKIFRPLF